MSQSDDELQQKLDFEFSGLFDDPVKYAKFIMRVRSLLAAEHARLLSDLRREMPKGMLREDYEILVNASINGQRREALVKAYELASKEALAAIDAELERLKGGAGK